MKITCATTEEIHAENIYTIFCGKHDVAEKATLVGYRARENNIIEVLYQMFFVDFGHSKQIGVS